MIEENVIKLLNTLITAGEAGIRSALQLCREIVFFRRDPREQEKIARRKTEPNDWTTRLEPRPRFEDWPYTQLLTKGVRPLALAAPFETAMLLLDAASQMMSLERDSQDDLIEGARNDASEIWCPSLQHKVRPYPEPKA